MYLYEAAQIYNSQHPGFGAAGGVPAPEVSAKAMQDLVILAKQSEPPAGGLMHLNEIVASVAELAPGSASIFNRLIVENSSQAEFAKTLELGYALMAQRSPETWKHVKNHAALTMLYYEKQTGLDKRPDPARTEQLLTLMVGAIGHDIGKVAIEPALLHKATRIGPERLGTAAENYRRLVPDYAEKLHDLMFLEEANKGRIVFADPAAPQAPLPAGDLMILDIGKDLRHSETYWSDASQQALHNAIWQRINEKAKAHVAPAATNAWLTDNEQKILTMHDRGTVTPEEMSIIATHDHMSEAFFRFASLPPSVEGVRDIVSMDRFRHPEEGKPQKNALAEIIHATDVYEALTADRSYRTAYTSEEALKVMDGMVKEGKINGDVIESLKTSGAIEAYTTRNTIKHSSDIALEVVAPGMDSSWVNRVLQFNPLEELNQMISNPQSSPIARGFTRFMP